MENWFILELINLSVRVQGSIGLYLQNTIFIMVVRHSEAELWWFIHESFKAISGSKDMNTQRSGSGALHRGNYQSSWTVLLYYHHTC